VCSCPGGVERKVVCGKFWLVCRSCQRIFLSLVTSLYFCAFIDMMLEFCA
jgi:hypothetical protein